MIIYKQTTDTVPVTNKTLTKNHHHSNILSSIENKYSLNL